MATCICRPFQSLLTELIGENEQLKQRMNAQEAEIGHLKNQFSSITNTLLKSGLSSEEKRSCNNCHDCLYLAAAGCNPAGYYHVYAYNHSIYKYNDEGERHGVSISYCKCCCHK